jgi:hypothetical protein
MKDNDSDEPNDGSLSKYINAILVGLFIVALVYLLSIFGYSYLHFPATTDPNATTWGTFGDYIGGLLNPVFSFLAFIALLFTIVLQRRELALSTKELKTSAKALKEQSESLKLQNFENTFFQMLKLHNEIIQGMEISHPPGSHLQGYRGRGCFWKYYEKFTSHYKGHGGDTPESSSYPDEKSLIDGAYNSFFKENDVSVAHYFRNLFAIIKFVDSTDLHTQDTKKGYVDILRAQLSSYELLLLFYHCLWHVERKEFKPFIDGYELLKFMDISALNNSDAHIRLYGKRAYGSQDVEKYYKT